MALWKAGGEVEIKRENLDHGIVEGRGGNLNTELEFRPWHCGRRGGEVYIKSWNLDYGIVEGRGGKVEIKS